jgi:endonuclease I
MKLLLTLFSLVLSNFIFAQIPTGYYDSAIGYSGDSLKSKLHLIIKDHIEFPYTSSGTDVWDILKETDRDTLDPTRVLLIYSGWSVDAAQEYNGGSGWSREHVWAKSRGDFGNSMGPGTDVHALRPCDVSVNGARNNRWFAECSTEYIDGDGPTGSYTSSSEWVWKPNDNVKGDVARMIFYMATRYEGSNGEPDLEVIDSIPLDNYTNEPIHAKLSDLYQWHIEDPVDDWERNRNNIIYYDYQNNRNPFIDHPEYADSIWGYIVMGVNKNSKLDRSLNVYPNPTKKTVTIDWKNKSSYLISIRDTFGRILLSKDVEGTKGVTLNLEDIDQGKYDVVVSDDNQSVSKPLIVN